MPRRARQPPRRYRGFSLVELTLTLTIMGILAAMAVPRFARASGRYQVEAAARRIVADLEQARQAARSASASVTVTFDLAADAYDIAYPTTTGVAASTRRMRLGLAPLSSDLTSVTFTAASNPLRVTFNGFGIPDSPGTLVIVSKGITRTITLAATTGVTTIQ